jgi:hypothetical protein
MNWNVRLTNEYFFEKCSLLTQTTTSRPTSSTKYRHPWATPNVDLDAHERIIVLKPFPIGSTELIDN